MHEIITLQLGQRSNYLATHYWNTQESYFTYSADEESPIDHDVSFRAGTGADGTDTFTPRTLIYDLKGGFGTLKKLNALYEAQDEPGIPRGLWDGPTAMHSLPPIGESQYQRSLQAGLEPPALTGRMVRYWSDFNRVFYHPRSIIQLNEYELNSALMPFERWESGEELFGMLDREHDLLDRDFRPFAEECDQLQALQLMTGADDAWGGFAARYVDRLRDEYGKTSIWVWGLEDGNKVQRERQNLKMVNMAKAFQEISSQASMYIPLADPPSETPPDVTIDVGSEWNTSALLSTALETLTIPSRAKAINGMRASLGEMEEILNANGKRKIGRLQLSQGDRSQGRTESSHNDGAATSHQATAGLSSYDMDLFLGMGESLPTKSKQSHTFGQVEVVRGIPPETEDGTVVENQAKPRHLAVDLPLVKIYRTPLPYPLLDSFPSIYKPSPRASQAAAIGAQAALGTGSCVADRLKVMRRMVGKLVGLEEREAMTDSLGEMAEEYEEGWESGSDEDDD